MTARKHPAFTSDQVIKWIVPALAAVCTFVVMDMRNQVRDLTKEFHVLTTDVAVIKNHLKLNLHD